MLFVRTIGEGKFRDFVFIHEFWKARIDLINEVCEKM